MPEYNFGYSEILITAADAVVADGLDCEAAKNTVQYLSLLACDIAMKSLLEKAGMPVEQIRKRTDDLGKMFDAVS